MPEWNKDTEDWSVANGVLDEVVTVEDGVSQVIFLDHGERIETMYAENFPDDSPHSFSFLSTHNIWANKWGPVKKGSDSNLFTFTLSQGNHYADELDILHHLPRVLQITTEDTGRFTIRLGILRNYGQGWHRPRCTQTIS